MHLTYSSNYISASGASKVSGEAFVRIDISDWHRTARLGRHTPIELVKDKKSAKGKCFYGAGFSDDFVSSPARGFPGSYRQFWMTLGYLKDEESILRLQHQYKVMDYSTMGYYKFESTLLFGRYDDAFRNQTGVPIGSEPLFFSENIAAPFCNSIPQKFEKVPLFFKSAGEKFKDVEIPLFNFKGRDYGYTISFWLKNFGQHSYSQNPSEGERQNHLIKIDESFAIWYSSPTSIRVYVYAKNNAYEVASDSVFLPLFEWVNIQISISQT